MIKYCTNCLFPETKPHLSFDEKGICNACINYKDRPEIDWNSREKELRIILDKYRSKSNYWDCIVPVSGGKDSTYQVLTMLNYGMSPLCVNSRTCDLSDLGRRNIENIKRLGVDFIEMSPNPGVRSKLNRIGLTQIGDISWPDHIGMFTFPFRLAVQMNIPLIIYGENSQHEYGGPADAVSRHFQDKRWLEEFGGMQGLRLSDVIGIDNIKHSDLNIYTFPSQEEMVKKDVVAIYLGHFLPWNGLNNYLISQAHGFESYGKAVEGGFVDYENLDNHQNGIHEYLKYLKYGYGRATDQASILIRRGLLNRSQALPIVSEKDGKFPWTYLGKRIEKILEPLNMSVEEFQKVCDQFTNRKIFIRDAKGNLIKDNQGNLKKINYDNA